LNIFVVRNKQLLISYHMLTLYWLAHLHWVL